jgi:hypothetical protein
MKGTRYYALGGVVVACLTLYEFKIGRERWTFKGDKNLQHDFLRRASKAFGPCRKILRHVKKMRVWKRYFIDKIPGPFLAKFSYFAARCLLLISRELWWTNQEWLEMRWGRTIDQKWSQCKGRLVHPHRNSDSSLTQESCAAPRLHLW